MAGIPPLLGFVTKEAAFDALIADRRWVVLGVAALASALTVAYTARFWWGAFEEQPGGVDVAHLGAIDRWLIVPAGDPLLRVAGVRTRSLGPRAASAMPMAPRVKLVLWPGWKPALAVSAAGLSSPARPCIGPATVREPPLVAAGDRTDPAAIGAACVRRHCAGAEPHRRSGDGCRAERFTACVPLGDRLDRVHGHRDHVDRSLDVTPHLAFTNGITEVLLAVIAIAAGVAATQAQRRMAAALLLGAVGFAIAGIYVTFGAPDLALTQLLIETFTVALFAFVLSRLPRRFGSDPRSISRPLRLAVAGLAGVFVTAAALLTTAVTPDRTVAQFYLDNAVAAGGRNVVNVILTDFRALDTLGEITVLAAAAIGISALITTRRRAARTRERSLMHIRFSPSAGHRRPNHDPHAGHLLCLRPRRRTRCPRRWVCGWSAWCGCTASRLPGVWRSGSAEGAANRAGDHCRDRACHRHRRRGPGSRRGRCTPRRAQGFDDAAVDR